ncbi:LysM domain-containing protein [Kyrpidia sp.]|nr:LysM peptidoglycan-binding domain-containing protein [Kyrpidia sp.]
MEIDIVRRGDTLWGICRRYGIEPECQPAWPPTAS